LSSLTTQQAIEDLHRRVCEMLPIVAGDFEWTTRLSSTLSTSTQRHPLDITPDQLLHEIMASIEGVMKSQ
jgi:hypothetical protein